MKVRVGILGLPNVGKSTLFNALAQKSLAQAANFPFCTIEPNIAPIAVPDEHLGERLRALAGLERTVPATIEWVDIAGLAKGASRGEGLGNKFLGTARDCDAICHVVRIFEDPDTIHVEGRVDPAADAEVVNLELLLADLAHAERRLEKASCRGEEREALEAVVSCLQRGEPARAAGLSEGARLSIKSMGTPGWGSNNHQQSAVAGALPQLSQSRGPCVGTGLLTLKPVLYAFNVDEADYTLDQQAARAAAAAVLARIRHRDPSTDALVLVSGAPIAGSSPRLADFASLGAAHGVGSILGAA